LALTFSSAGQRCKAGIDFTAPPAKLIGQGRRGFFILESNAQAIVATAAGDARKTEMALPGNKS
jgi:hypothetical protein